LLPELCSEWAKPSEAPYFFKKAYHDESARLAQFPAG
jgi:hypothetical protein